MQSTSKIIIAHRGVLFRDCLQAALISHNFVVSTTSNESSEFFQLIREFNPQLVIIDCKLHDIDGLDLLKQLKISNPEIKVIVFVNQFVDELRRFEKDADGLLNSNCRLSELLHCIKEVLSNRKYCVQFSELLNIDFDRSPEFSTLTRKEKIILRHISAFKTTTEIASELSISQSTIQAHKASIMKKLKLSGRNALLQFAFSLPQVYTYLFGIFECKFQPG